MSLFSEKLKEYVQKSHISVSKLSTEVEVDRTLFHKYLSGSRLPKSCQEVKRIGYAMMLLPKQQNILMEYYAKSVYGEKNYESFGKIRHILEGMNDLRVESVSKILDMDIVKKLSLLKGEEGASFYGKLQVEYALTQLLWLAAGKSRKERVKVRMMVQPNQDSIIKPILQICSRLNVELEHIICLDCNRNDNDNIGLLFSTLAFEFCDVTYQSYFYYDNIDYHVNQMSLLPNMILVGEYVFLCSAEVDKCLIIRQKTEVEFFQREYERMKNNTQKLGVINPNVEKSVETMSLMTDNGTIDLQIGYFPYLTAGAGEKLLQQHLLLEPEIKKRVIQATEQTLVQLMERKQFRNYFSELGLRRFMEDGMIPEYPSDIFLPFSREERIGVLNRLILLLKGGCFSFYMTKGNQICMKDAITIYANKEGNVNFWCKSGSYGKAIMVKEASIGDSVHCFADFAEENDWFYSNEETIERMEQFAKKYLA